MEGLKGTINNIATHINIITVPLATLALVIIGLLYIFARDPNKKEQYHSWIISVVIGFALVYLASSIAQWFTEQVVGYKAG
ncbi:pilin [Bacillus smithii]|uniref:pilin n=1 Tax=Bacillus smithii TaxID=1479 RepID=UPI00077BB0A9|nr:pilin [Bacillus smithii]MED4882764.1 pilin [Bacillus smithii]MED4928432.1 pilin [Bacillus smithii]